MSTKLIGLLALAFLAAQGCASPDVRPKDANIFQATGNVVTGEFEDQTKRDELELLETQKEIEDEQQTKATLEDKADQARADRLAALQELAALKQENSDLEKEIKKKKASTAGQIRAKNEQLEKLVTIREEISALEAASSMPADDYKKQVEQLSNEIQILREIAASQ